jgi:hypothetical protein
MERLMLLLPLTLLSVPFTVILIVGAGIAGSVCHCMTPMFTLFPYGSFISQRTSWEYVGFFLMLFQFPLYVTIVAGITDKRWKTATLMLIIALHFLVALFGVRDYCQSHHTCDISAPSNKRLERTAHS